MSAADSESTSLDAIITSLRAAAEQQPTDARRQFELGNALAEARRHAEAAAVFERVIALRPDVAVAHFNLANACLALEQWERALQALQTCVSLEPTPDAYENLAYASVRCRQLESARSALEHALKLDPHSVTARGRLARLLLDLGRERDAFQQIDEGLRLMPEEPRMYAELAQLQQAVGRMGEALTSWRRAVDADPDQVEWRIYLATLLRLTDQTDEAERIIRAGIARHPHDDRLQRFLNAALQ